MSKVSLGFDYASWMWKLITIRPCAHITDSLFVWLKLISTHAGCYSVQCEW